MIYLCLTLQKSFHNAKQRVRSGERDWGVGAEEKGWPELQEWERNNDRIFSCPLYASTFLGEEGERGVREEGEERARERGGATVETYSASIPALLPKGILISFQQPPILKAITSRRSCSYPWLQDAPNQGHQEAAECECQFWSQMVWTKIPAFSPTSGATLTK